MKDIILKTELITKFFFEPNKFKVLDNINFEVTRGEFLALVGKSGSGKSTLLYLLSTMDTDYEGSIMINNSLISKTNQNELALFRNENIGFVFQFHYLLPEFSALENVMIPALKLNKFSKEEIELNAYSKLEMLGLKEQALKKANKLSGGQQQRVAIARALINNPAIIMGDEPTGNLDSSNTQVVFDIFREISKETKQTIIAVTHDDDFAKNCDRTIILKDGKII